MERGIFDNLLVSYHGVSTVGLDPSEQEELENRLQSQGISANFKPFISPKEPVLPVASIIPEPGKLIIVVNGILSASPLLSGIVRELFLFWDKNWRRIKKQKSVGHFAIILEINVEGRSHNVGIDFKDDTTLAINFYRLHEYVKNPATNVDGSTLVELEYPKGGGIQNILAAFSISAILSIIFSQTKDDVSGFLPWALYTIVLILIWGVTLVVPQYKRRKYQVKFRNASDKWAFELNPQRGVYHDTPLRAKLSNHSVAPGSELRIIKILFLAANPISTPPLRLDEEIRAIDDALQSSEYRNRFDIKQHWAIRVSDIQKYLLRHKPDIVHFCGHGSINSEIILEDTSGQSVPISVRALSQLFSVLKDNIKCVVLNACYSKKQADAIAQCIHCVVGMSRSISDEAAIGFAASFYQALGFGRNVKTAFELGCAQIDIEGLNEQDTPKLVSLNHKPEDIVFIEL